MTRIGYKRARDGDWDKTIKLKRFWPISRTDDGSDGNSNDYKVEENINEVERSVKHKRSTIEGGKRSKDCVLAPVGMKDVLQLAPIEEGQ